MILPSTTDDRVFDGLSPGDLYRYARTCKDAHEAVESYIRRKFDLHDLLGRYFKPDEIFHFRKLQAHTGMFVSGSTALQFLERVIYPESDLDLYVEHHYRSFVANWLVLIGYEYISPITYPDETLEDALKLVADVERTEGAFHKVTEKGYFGAVIVLNFEKSEPRRKIQLMTAHHSPLNMVLNFHSTGVMNIITHDKAYSLYPRGTFDERRSLLYLTEEDMKRNNGRAYLATLKYAERGWTIIYKISRHELNNPRSAFSHGQRHVGDGKCWTLPILPKLDLPASNIETNSWTLVYDSELVPDIQASVFVSDKLRHGYLISDEPLRKHVSKISRALNDLCKGEQDLDYLFGKFIEIHRKSLLLGHSRSNKDFVHTRRT